MYVDIFFLILLGLGVGGYRVFVVVFWGVMGRVCFEFLGFVCSFSLWIKVLGVVNYG